MNRKLLILKPTALESFKVLGTFNEAGKALEPWQETFFLRPGDTIWVTKARATQLLTDSETFALRGRPELWAFLDDCCEESKGEVELSKLWEAYSNWAQKQRKPPMLRETFERELSEIFELVESEKGPSLRGLRLKEEK